MRRHLLVYRVAGVDLHLESFNQLPELALDVEVDHEELSFGGLQ